jgi:hypothetical protein
MAYYFASKVMIIRQNQIQAIDDAMFIEYQRRLIAFYRDRAPGFISRFSDAQLKQRIARAVPRARAFGLDSAEGIMQYVGLALAAGSKFDEDPKVCEFMGLPGSAPEVKVKRLLQLVLKKLNEFGESKGENG